MDARPTAIEALSRRPATSGLILDFDGVLSPIVEDPATSALPASTAALLARIVKVNVLIYSMLEYGNMNDVYREFFPDDPPARTVCGAGLIGGHKVEIDCVALV